MAAPRDGICLFTANLNLREKNQTPLMKESRGDLIRDKERVKEKGREPNKLQTANNYVE